MLSIWHYVFSWGRRKKIYFKRGAEKKNVAIAVSTATALTPTEKGVRVWCLDSYEATPGLAGEEEGKFWTRTTVGFWNMLGVTINKHDHCPF